MSKYRICPASCLNWKVQRRKFYFFWLDEKRYSWPGEYSTRLFSRETEAETYINDQLRYESLKGKHKELQRRHMKIKPRRYP